MCNENLKHAPIMPIAAKPSQYGIDPSLVKRRVAELPGMCSLRLAELFPELPPVIYPGGHDALDKLYQVAMEELRKVAVKALEECRMDTMNDWASIKSEIKNAISGFLSKKTKRNPMILPVIMEV